MSDRSMTRRATFLAKSLLMVTVAVAALAGTSMVASAYPPPKEHESIECSKDKVDVGQSCHITYIDHDKDGGARAGQTICFTVSPANAGTVSPSCTTTDSKGEADATFTALSGACSGGTTASKSNDGDDSSKVTITGTEVSEGGGVGSAPSTTGIASAHTTVQVSCPDTDGDSGTTSTTSGGTTNTNFRTAAASTALPAISPVASFSLAGILVAMVLVAVAITGRLRLRRRRN